MNNNTYISLIAIVLIYIYWKNKKPNNGLNSLCPESLRDALSTSNAPSFWINESNNLHINNYIQIENEFGANNVEYGICITATDNGLDQGYLTEKDVQLIRDCACRKMINTNELNASSFVRVSTFI